MGALHEVEVDDIEDEAESKDIVDHEFSLGASPLKTSNKIGSLKDRNPSIQEGVSMSDNNVDDLLNWANALPDGEKFQASGSSFFK